MIERQVYRGRRDDTTDDASNDDVVDDNSFSPMKLAQTTPRTPSPPVMKPFSNRTDVLVDGDATNRG